jgi:hypothetical protein
MIRTNRSALKAQLPWQEKRNNGSRPGRRGLGATGLPGFAYSVD